jgi:hypothetical protein
VSSRTLVGFVAAGIAAFVFLRPGGDETWPIRNAVPGRGPIVCFGDSLTSGHGAEPARSYPAVLGSLVGREVVNRGRNGDTAAASLARVDDVLSLEPAVVVLTLGGNDMLQRVPIEQTVAAIRSIFDRLLAAGPWWSSDRSAARVERAHGRDPRALPQDARVRMGRNAMDGSGEIGREWRIRSTERRGYRVIAGKWPRPVSERRAVRVGGRARRGVRRCSPRPGCRRHAASP